MSALATPSLAQWPCAGLWLTQDGCVGALNPECAQTLGLCEELAQGQPLAELLTPASRLLWLSAFWPALQLRQRIDDAALVFETPSGPWTATAALRSGQLQGQGGYTVLLLPAGERQRLHDELRAARRSLDAIPGAVLQCRHLGSGALAFSYASAGVLELLGLTPAQVSSDSRALLGALLPQDAQAFIDGLLRAESRLQARAQRRGLLEGEPEAWRVSVHAQRDPHRTLEWVAQHEQLASGQLQWHGVLLDVSERERLQGELREQVATDDLTRLPNRRGLMQHLQAAIASQRPFALLFMDVDRFKQINDSLGHEAGDELLREVARRLRQALRPADRLMQLPSEAPPTAADRPAPPAPDQDHATLAARLGGDEFVVLAEGLADRQAVAALADRLLARLGCPYALGHLQVHPGVSIGIVLGDGQSQAAQLMRDADTAMYEAKRLGRGRYAHFEPDMHVRAASALALEADLRAALLEGQLRAAFQPIVEITSGRVVGIEALARWRHPTRGEVSPGVFIPVAEEAGLVAQLGEQVLELACMEFQAWRAQGLPLPARISVNLSRAQLQDATLPQRVLTVLGRCGLETASLQLEITESLAMQDEGARQVLHALRRLGIRLSLDDFGTGHSSLSALQQLPVQQLKIDRSFVRELETSAYHRALVQAALQVARALQLEVVAEGVETQSQARALAQLGCERAQGYLYARPLEADAMLGYLQARLTADPAQLLPAELQRAGHVRAHQVVITDAQGLTTFVNPAFSLNTGYTLDEMLGRKPGALLQRADASPEAVRQLSEAVSSGQGCMGVEIVNYRKNGEPFWVLIDIEPVRDAEGRIERFVSVQTEITAQRAALAELDRLRSRANRVAALGLVGFWEHELANGQTWADATCRQLLGLSKGQDLPAGQQMLRLVTPESRQALQAFKEQVTGGARRGLLECSVVHDDGGTVHLQSVWVREDDRLLGVLADVSGTQHLRREREELLGQLELASTAARQFFWAHDLRTGEVSWLPPHGHPYPVDAQGQCRGEDVLKAVLPEDLPIVLKARADACSQPGVVEATYRIRDRQGQVRHLLTRRLGWRPRGARPDSPVQRQIGISVDITTEREQQLQLQVLARENEVVLAAARLAPFRLDLEQMEFSFGPAFARLYGLAEGSTRLSIAEWESRVHPQDLATVRAAGRALRASAEAGIAEARFRIIRPDGAIRQVRGHRSVLRDAQGRPLAVLGAHADLGPAS